MDKIERARQQRKAAMMAAKNLSDAQAAEVPTMFKPWAAGEAVSEGDRRCGPDGKLYKARQAHTTQSDWLPDATPALWAVIDVSHAGTAADPIPAARGMDYTYGLYYSDPEDGKVYLCSRNGAVEGETINLQYLPHELVGNYFTPEAI